MSDPDQTQNTTESGQLQTNDRENRDDGIYIPAEGIQQLHQARDDETRVDIPPEIDSRCIHRVPQHMREKNQHLYDPVVVSLGPYHHGKHQYRKMEEIKEELLNKFISDNIAKDPSKDRKFFYKEIFNRIKEIRDNYEHEGVDEYNDEALTEIILRDACFLTVYIQDYDWTTDMILNTFGMSTLTVFYVDCILLENQIPYWVIKYLLDLSFGENEANVLVLQHFNSKSWKALQLKGLPWKDNNTDPPLHALEAERAMLLGQGATSDATTRTEPHIFTKIFKGKKIQKTNDNNNLDDLKTENFPFRSVTYLQTKGIHFRPSSLSLRDIIFTSYPFHGVLQLPIRFISNNSQVYYFNVVAYEMRPGNPLDDFIFTSYVNFMKSLIQSSKDVKELRDKGILFSDLGSDEEVVKVFKEIHTYGIDDYDSFAQVKMQIDEHCNSRVKTWIAEFIHNYFHSPWTTIALFAAIFLLCLTFLQTFYTIRPKN